MTLEKMLKKIAISSPSIAEIAMTESETMRAQLVKPLRPPEASLSYCPSFSK